MEVDYIERGDCLHLMRELPDECIDLIITSPPYNLGNKHHTDNYTFRPYANYNDNLPECEYQKWQVDVLNECHRILKANGSLLYNHKNRIRNGLQISPYEWLYKTNFTIKQEIVWFNRSQNFDKCRFYPMTERIYWLTKSPKTKLFNAISHHDVFDAKEWKPQGTKGKFKRAFPVKMVKDLLSCFPNANIVLDPFLGSGTTAVACVECGKHYIGFELCEEHYNIACERLDEVELREVSRRSSVGKRETI